MSSSNKNIGHGTREFQRHLCTFTVLADRTIQCDKQSAPFAFINPYYTGLICVQNTLQEHSVIVKYKQIYTDPTYTHIYMCVCIYIPYIQKFDRITAGCGLSRKHKKCTIKNTTNILYSSAINYFPHQKFINQVKSNSCVCKNLPAAALNCVFWILRHVRLRALVENADGITECTFLQTWNAGVSSTTMVLILCESVWKCSCLFTVKVLTENTCWHEVAKYLIS